MTTLIMLTNQLRNSGPNRVMLNIARMLNRSKVKPVVVTLMPDDTIRPIADQFEKAGVEMYRFNHSKLDLETRVLFIRNKIESFITANFSNPVVQAHGYHPTLLTSGMSVPNTVTIHSIASEDFVNSKGWLLGSYMVWRFKRHLKRHKYPVAISGYMMDYYKKVCGQRIRLIHNGVSLEPEKCDVMQLKQQLKLPGDKKIIVIPGGLTSGKNNIYTIRQLKSLGADNFFCVFIGLGPQLELLREEVKDDTRFRFEGYRSNIVEYLSCADLYISSSLSEGLPLAALEALCMGVPSLLSNIPPHSEITEIMNTRAVKTFSLTDNELAKQVPIFFKSTFDNKAISKVALKYFSSYTMALKYEELIEDIQNNQ